MPRRRNAGRGAVATGAAATGAASMGAMAMGAVALGALAVGALAIGRLSIGRARLRRVEIGELRVGRLDIGTGGPLTAVARVRAAPGKGDALQHLLLEGAEPGSLFAGLRRSLVDPDLFLLCAGYADESAFARLAAPPRLHALLRRAAASGLLAAPAEVPVEVELFAAV
ncbi:MAG: hypothetical protein U1E59_00885 [Amaricoccus sp.]